jgi:glycosyltransferase involved in cell wall biosynthesis
MINHLTVLFNTYPVAFDCPGGGEVQLLKYEQYLTALGVKVLRYDSWNPQIQFNTANLVHHFSLQPGSSRFCDHVVNVRKLPLVISTIAWFEPRKGYYPSTEIERLLNTSIFNLPNSQMECNQIADLTKTPKEKFIPIVNGVDDIFFETVSPSIFRNHCNIKRPFVLCMGNIEARKNQHNLITALAGTGLHLVLAGQNREADYAKKCRALADETVYFIGKLEHGSLLQRSAYAAAELLCLPSMLETPGLAALEAAAAGCRLALTRVGCTEEYFGEFATYCDPDDVASIRTTVQTALAKPRPEGLSDHVQKNYTWTRAAEQLIDVYQRILNENSKYANMSPSIIF